MLAEVLSSEEKIVNKPFFPRKSQTQIFLVELYYFYLTGDFPQAWDFTMMGENGENAVIPPPPPQHSLQLLA